MVIDFLKHFSYFICAIKGHDINPEESLVDDIMIDKRNWLCKCNRCNWYVMCDGATRGCEMILTKHSAEQISCEFHAKFGELYRRVEDGL